MFGFIHESIRQLMFRKYGEEFWQKVLDRAGFENGKENIVNHYYPDSDTYQLVDSVAVFSKMSREAVWELYGAFLIEYTMELGWDELGFLDSLDSLHYFIDHVVYKANLRGPSFRTEESNDETIILHYFTGRPGLYPIVRGVIKEVARRVYNLDVSLSITGRTQRSVQMAVGERVEEHVIFQIKQVGIVGSTERNSTSSDTSMLGLPQTVNEMDDCPMKVTALDFSEALPYHFIFDEDCRLIHAGKELYNHIPKDMLQRGTPILRIFEITRPQIPADFDNICNFINAVFVLQVFLQKMIYELSSRKHMIYLCSPYVTSINEMMQFGMRLTAMPLHDSTRDLILLNQQRLTDVEVNLQLEANNEQLEAMARDLEIEKSKTDALLKDMLPASVAAQLISSSHIDACEYEEATVMFSDVPNFQQIVPQCQPNDVVHLLNELFSRFDRLITLHNLYKVETVGDSYMTVGGVPDFSREHCEIVCHVALGMIWEARFVQDPVAKKPLHVRIGIHAGPIVAGVVGAKMPRYCLFGDTVNTASRMEAASCPGKIHISEKAHAVAISTGRFEFQHRGRVAIRGKGDMDTYFLLSSLKKSIWEIVEHENTNTIDGYEELAAGCLDAEKISVHDTNQLNGNVNMKKWKLVSKACSVM